MVIIHTILESLFTKRKFRKFYILKKRDNIAYRSNIFVNFYRFITLSVQGLVSSLGNRLIESLNTRHCPVGKISKKKNSLKECC